MPRFVEPIGHVAETFEAADRWDVEQRARMTLEERLAIAEELRRRAYGDQSPDVRESERQS